MGEMTDFQRPDGNTAPAYHADPREGREQPGIVVIQEWWGINAQMKGIADRLANGGFRTVVPDLYRGRLAADADEAEHFMGDLDWQGATHQDLQGAVDWLRETGAPKVAVLGFCMGGALTIAASVHVRGLDAGVCFYGIPPKELADPSAIRVPMLLHFAEHDDWCNDAAQAQLEADMKRGDVDYRLYRYAGTQHAFMNEARPEVFDEEAAEAAWERTLGFLREEIG